MLDNHAYNLLLQLTQEHKSLWRIKELYKQDAGNCAQCREFWVKMEEDKRAHVAELTQMLATHLPESE